MSGLFQKHAADSTTDTHPPITEPPLISDLSRLQAKRQAAQERLAAFDVDNTNLAAELRRLERGIRKTRRVWATGTPEQAQATSRKLADLQIAFAQVAARQKMLNAATASSRQEITTALVVIDRDIQGIHERADHFRANIQSLKRQIEQGQIRVGELKHATSLAELEVATKQRRLAELEQQLQLTIGEEGHGLTPRL